MPMGFGYWENLTQNLGVTLTSHAVDCKQEDHENNQRVAEFHVRLLAVDHSADF
jgi:hypothetical protein